MPNDEINTIADFSSCYENISPNVSFFPNQKSKASSLLFWKERLTKVTLSMEVKKYETERSNIVHNTKCISHRKYEFKRYSIKQSFYAPIRNSFILNKERRGMFEIYRYHRSTYIFVTKSINLVLHCEHSCCHYYWMYLHPNLTIHC